MNEYPPKRPRQKTLKIVLVVIIFLLALGAGVLWRGWQSFVRFGVASDLSQYQATVSQSDLDPEVKRRLVGRIDLVRERARDKYIGFWRWLSYEQSFRTIFEDKRVSPDEVLVLERELYRLEKEFE